LKITITIVAALGLVLLESGYFSGKSSDADTAFSAIILSMVGGCLLAGDLLLIGGYTLYRLLTS
jgi:hypothetical protein